MKVLVACEFSGIVRDAFIEAGHYATSCDLLPTEKDGPHYVGDVRLALREHWDLVIAHPPCTYIANSGVRWLYNKDGTINNERWVNMQKACVLFNDILYAYTIRRCDKLAIENPIPHKHSLKLIGSKYDQIIHPWQFGHGETKATCLWLRGLPKLEPTDIVDGREHRIHKMSPGPNRSKDRSRTYQGIADAMAEQWG